MISHSSITVGFEIEKEKAKLTFAFFAYLFGASMMLNDELVENGILCTYIVDLIMHGVIGILGKVGHLH